LQLLNPGSFLYKGTFNIHGNKAGHPSRCNELYPGAIRIFFIRLQGAFLAKPISVLKAWSSNSFLLPHHEKGLTFEKIFQHPGNISATVHWGRDATITYEGIII
jgi:hypothetical protein